jgi:hypothetical protein
MQKYWNLLNKPIIFRIITDGIENQCFVVRPDFSSCFYTIVDGKYEQLWDKENDPIVLHHKNNHFASITYRYKIDKHQKEFKFSQSAECTSNLIYYAKMFVVESMIFSSK